MGLHLESRIGSLAGVLGRGLLAAAAVAAVGLTTAQAQTAPDLSIIDRRLKQGETTARPKPAPSAPRLEKAAPQPAPPALQPFTLSGLIVNGATVYPPSAFTGAYEGYLARRVGDVEVEAILQRITRRYVDDGYFLTRAIAPAQEITAGLLRVQVIEGYISKFSTTGDYPDAAMLEAYVRSVLRERPARLQTVERALLLISDLPGVTVKPRLVPIREADGDYELIADIDYRPVTAFGRLDNRGTPDVGRLQGWVGMGLNGMLGFGESINANFVTVPDQPKELLYGSLGATLPVGNPGTILALTGSYGAIDAGGPSAALDKESTSKQLVGRINHPLLRSRAQSLWINGIFDYRNFHETEFDQTTIDDRLRVLRGGATYSLSDDFKGDSQAGFEVSQGLDILGASRTGSFTLSRADGHSQFTKVAVNAARLQKITDRIGVRLGLAGQWASEPLLAYEEFGLGGEYFGRAYDYGERTGEHGIAGSGELRYGGETNWPWLSEYQVYGFYDIGAVWNKTSGDGLAREDLSSAGGGFRLRFTDVFRTGFEAAKPLDERVSSTGNRDWRFFFTAIATY